MHLNHYENPYSRLARYELRMRQHGLTAQAMLMTSDNTQLRTWRHACQERISRLVTKGSTPRKLTKRIPRGHSGRKSRGQRVIPTTAKVLVSNTHTSKIHRVQWKFPPRQFSANCKRSRRTVQSCVRVHIPQL